MKKLLAVILLIAFLCVAITHTETDNEVLLTIWFILLVAVALPLLLLAIRDFLTLFVGRSWQGPLLLHVCAVFAALLGYGVGQMAVQTDHPQAHAHQWMTVLFPLFVYITPLLIIFRRILNGASISEVMYMLKYFYFGGK